MKLKCLLVLCLMCMAWPMIAYNVTFRLQMTGVSGFTTPEVNGTFNDWCGTCNQMADANNDGIWEATIALPAGYFEYKYSADNWSLQEALVAGSSCTATTGQFTNRTLNVTGDLVLPVVCWGSCSSCSTFNVTFQVNMASVTGFTTPYVSGGFNEWCGNCNPMSDPDGDNIWSATIPLLSGYYEYKFSYDNWQGAETLPVGASCTITTFGFTNRFVNVGQNQTLSPVCWETCDTPNSGGGPTPEVQIALTTGTNPSCEMSDLVFTATASNLLSTPQYQWQVDGVNVGANASTYSTNDIVNGQIVQCILTGGVGCGLGSVVSSNAITVTRQAIVTPAISISASPAAPWCNGQEITFTATPTHGGTSPVYQWRVDGQNVGNGGSSFIASNLLPNQNVTCSMVSNAACQSSAWNMIWSDEFNGTSLDLTKWTPELGASGWGNNEWQNYTNSANNIQFNNGQLHIVARNDGPPNLQYTSARLITKNNFSFKYGKITGRLQIPSGQGIWPAFWMLGANIDQVSWPSCGEIDIMEHINSENKIYGTAHWNNNGLASNSGNINTSVNGFHDYTLEWDSLSLRFIMDGITYHQHTISSGNGSMDEFTKPFFLLLNVAVGGNWPGYPNASTVFPVSMDVDFVRVWQRNPNTAPQQVTSNAITVQSASSSTWHLDSDGDGYGSLTTFISTCNPPSNYVTNNTDCDDGNNARHPNATEICNGIDDNCNGTTDEGFPDLDGDLTADCVDNDTDGDNVANALDCAPSNSSIWQSANLYVDADNDGFGTGNAISLCIGTNLPVGYASNNLDCDDNNPNINEGGIVITSTIEGQALVCRNQTFVYAIEAVPGANQYAWTWPSGATGSAVANTLTLIIGNAFQGGSVCVAVSGSCSAGVEVCKSLTVITAAPASISYIEGSGTVCPNTNYTYTISAVPNTTDYIWTAPTNATLVSGQGTTSATFSFNSSYVNGNIAVRAINCYGQSGLRTRYITKKPLPSRPGIVAGASIVCPNTVEIYSIAAATNAESYIWTAPAGASVVSGQGGLTVEIAFGPDFISGNIQVVSTNCSGTSGIRTKATARKALPGTVGLISGNRYGACSAQINTYTVPAISNTDAYIWTAPSHASIISGQGTTSVQVAFAPEFVVGQLIVRGQNCSGTSALILPLGIEKITPVPTTITGPLNGVCQGSTHTFSTPVIQGATNYIWTVPQGAIINGASNGTSISVTFPTPFVSGSITVKSATSCFTSAAKSIHVTSLLAQPGVIAGTSTGLMGGSTYTYSIAPMNGASSYNWNVPVGWMITSNTGNAISVTVPIGGFNNASISVSAVNSCGNSMARTLNLTGVLGSQGFISGGTTYCEQEREMNYAWSGALDVDLNWEVTNGSIVAEDPNTKQIRVKWEGHNGQLSALGRNLAGEMMGATLRVEAVPCQAHVQTTAANAMVDWPMELNNLRVYPNPTDAIAQLEFESADNQVIEMHLFNSLGQSVWTKHVTVSNGWNRLEIDLSHLTAGMYYVALHDGQKRQSVAVMKE